MLILLPPSEGKAPDGGKGTFADTHPYLLPDVGPILKHIERLKVADRAKFYGFKDAAKAKVCHALNRRALGAPCLIALERYTGVVYQYLDYPSLKKKANARDRIHIVSGLFGAIPAGTRIPNYKLPVNPWLVRYWKNKNLERVVKASKDKPVLNLLSQSYAKAVPVENAITIDFRVEGGKKSAGHFGKAIKGRFVRFLIENDITDISDFGAFEEDGYAFNGTDLIQS